MVRIIVLAVLLLITGCTSNDNMTQKEITSKQKRNESHARTTIPSGTITQASSTTTAEAGMQQMQMTNSNWNDWYDWFNRGQVPIGSPSDQMPVKQPVAQVPTNKPADQTTSNSQFEQQVLDLVNKERANVGLNPLSMNGELSKMAMVKAQDMYNNNYFDHNSPTYGSPFDMMKQFGIVYNSAGENIAKGQSSPVQVMNDWMNSPGHRANILKSSFNQIGIAYYNGAWVQEFIG